MNLSRKFPYSSVDYGGSGTTVIREERNCSQDVHFQDIKDSIQKIFREQTRSDIAEEDCTKPMNALLNINDLSKKGAYKGLTRRMTFEETNAGYNVELANLSPVLSSNVVNLGPDSTMSLEEMQQWLDNELETVQDLTTNTRNVKSKLQKIVHQSNKIEHFLNEKAPNNQIKPEKDNGQISRWIFPDRNAETRENRYAAERSLFFLQKYVGAQKKSSKTLLEAGPSVHEAAEPRIQPQSLTSLVDERIGSQARSRRGEAGGKEEVTESARRTLRRLSAEATLRPELLRKEKRRCDTTRPHPHNPSRGSLDNEPTPSQLTDPHNSRLLSKKANVRQARVSVIEDGQERNSSHIIPHTYESTAQPAHRVKSSLFVTQRSKDYMNRREILNGPKNVNDTNKKLHRIDKETTTQCSLSADLSVDINKKYNREVTSRTVTSTCKTTHSNVQVCSKKCINVNKQHTSKNFVSNSKVLQHQEILKIGQEYCKTVGPLEITGKQIESGIEEAPKEMPVILESPLILKLNCCGLQSGSLACVSESENGGVPLATLERSVLQRNGDSGGEGKDKDSVNGHGVGEGVREGEGVGEGGGRRAAGEEEGGGEENGGTGEGGGELYETKCEYDDEGCNTLSWQLSTTEMVRQWLCKSPLRPNVEYARNVKKQQSDYATFSKAQKSAQLQKIYGRRMASVVTARPVVNPQKHSVRQARCRPEWIM